MAAEKDESNWKLTKLIKANFCEKIELDESDSTRFGEQNSKPSRSPPVKFAESLQPNGGGSWTSRIRKISRGRFDLLSLLFSLLESRVPYTDLHPVRGGGGVPIYSFLSFRERCDSAYSPSDTEAGFSVFAGSSHTVELSHRGVQAAQVPSSPLPPLHHAPIVGCQGGHRRTIRVHTNTQLPAFL